ncbi:high-affinity branched-chain amino acid ABC transporter permease LivM [Candidatus Competibacter phosphatis]|uniref:High-affinity branched-chain amino acid ABC transporter permease LivM n=1 Tax=Candidatus Competibacter phosphatis TaxID=221280 RepID=A0ABX1TL04_9GAMM|nr:high-affinity branched-chain amino acid ABC transporter permease LivM [Candidatus Competibacter phosphatis]NMQ19367.1 high-affinity branched-chain amino acid ABC transporter permease LivM [Candidatus Competibacter phosphatis]
MRRALPEALLAAMLTAVLAVPIFGLRIHVDGIDVSLDRTPTPVVVAVVIVFLLRLFQGPLRAAWARARPPAAWRNPLADVLRRTRQQPRYRTLLWMLLLIAAVIWPFTASRGAVDVVTLALIYVMLGLGLNIVVGFAGLLVLGYAAFYAVGAYTYALLAQHYGLSFWLSLPVAGVLAALTGFLLGLPVLRLRGDYLAIVTLGFGEITRLLLNNLNVLTGGPDGIGNIPRPTLFGLEFGRRASEGNATFHEFFGIDYSGEHAVIFLYLLGLALVVLILFVINRLQRMPLGRAWEALREDEIACRSLGLNPTVIKLSALTLSAAFAGLAGAFFAARQGYINPESFTFIESAMVLAIVVLGGMGSQLGVMLAAIAITALPELAREFNEYRMLAFGLVMVLMMIWRPQGLVPATRPRLELPERAEPTP